jgi:hypothetical protein
MAFLLISPRVCVAAVSADFLTREPPLLPPKRSPLPRNAGDPTRRVVKGNMSSRPSWGGGEYERANSGMMS